MAEVPRRGPALRQTGVILFVERYDACVAFYRDVFGLPVVTTLDELTIFAFGDGYLEIERGGTAVDPAKSRQQNPTVLRFDVADLDDALARLQAQGVAADRFGFDWGDIAVVVDPDGNRCELKRHDPAQTVGRERTAHEQ